MGRSRRKQERALADLLGATVKAARRKALEDALEVTARKLFEDEAAMVIALLEQGTPEEVLAALPRLRREVMEPRWNEVMKPLLAGVMAAQAGR